MSFVINDKRTKLEIPVKTFGAIFKEDVVFIGDFAISIEDFLYAACYVLTNTDLRPEDPRLDFVECIKSMGKVDGFNKRGSERLQYAVPPVIEQRPKKKT